MRSNEPRKWSLVGKAYIIEAQSAYTFNCSILVLRRCSKVGRCLFLAATQPHLMNNQTRLRVFQSKPDSESGSIIDYRPSGDNSSIFNVGIVHLASPLALHSRS